MTAGSALAPGWTAAILVLAVVSGMARLLLRRRRAPREQRGPGWRWALLLALQPMAGLLLFLVLHPPSGVTGGLTLVVATRGATSGATQDGLLVALPEAGPIPGAERTPDLATALRRHPETARIRLLGEGLSARDRLPLAIPVEHAPPPRPRGFVDVALPPPTAPGAPFAVGGQIGALPSGVVELVDPAGAVVARDAVSAGDRFVLQGAARTAGLAVFDLRLRDASGRLIERLEAPLETRADPSPRVVVLAGAPGAEINLLRRWARAAGIDLAVGVDLGAGVQLNEGAPALTRASLAQTDLLVIDDRRWEALDPSERAAAIGAVEAGMGLLLRPTGPLAGGTRREWAILGAPVSGEGDSRPLALGGEDAPRIARRNLADLAPEAVTVIPGPDGAPLASWRARGRGRIAVWSVVDSYVLALAGRPDLHAELWSTLFSELGRPVSTVRPRMIGLARAGERSAVCGVPVSATVRGSDGARAQILRDPAAGLESCAAFWPSVPGWRLAVLPDGVEASMYVHPANAGPGLNADQISASTIARQPDLSAPRRPAPPPGVLIFLALLGALAGLWMLERMRPARTPRGEAATGSDGG